MERNITRTDTHTFELALTGLLHYS